ncbi:TadE/TadG family type IV pilus assembly protein [Lihuaxuella thermophila]|uniref:TadE-like protein n=1 Tax=Lihuaxuella thermophila TaxID=1173111 RepID=A0A1H8I3U9_9BACL|nr:TadE family protein [Lihuaxuella thermophila]SEN63002.1 TadE-like protein [Lihuaxuella thermophila]
MKNMIKKMVRVIHSNKKGSSTIEFVIILPLFIMMFMVVWQMALAGMAVLDTQAALRDAARVAANSGDVNKGRAQLLSSFGTSDHYRLKNYSINISGDKVVAKAQTEIEVLFMGGLAPFTYNKSVEVPVLDDKFMP